jgi:LAO/AO transport system kinase
MSHQDFNIKELVTGILSSGKVALARGITLIESKNTQHRKLADDLLNRLIKRAGNSFRIGITGVPGAGKSTMIESLGLFLVEQRQRKLAVLAVDPSSSISGGSILGDKTRMNRLSNNPNVFIRPTPAGLSLGGVAERTRESIILCEAAGFDTLMIETVGVGQSETAVGSMVDLFVLLMLPGAGDELQGIKRGIMEMADLIIINKSEAGVLDKANEARRNYESALHLFPSKVTGWMPKVLLASALYAENMETISHEMDQFHTHVNQNGYFQSNRVAQDVFWFNDSLGKQLEDFLMANPKLSELKIQLERDVRQGSKNPFTAARELVDGLTKGLIG